MSGESQPIRVLHVDDDPDLADLAATFLEREDERLTVQTATRADDALDRLDAVDCVVSDFDMPAMDGIEFLERVRETHPSLPFILYTGKGSEAVASDAISAGVTDYLQKESGTGQYAVLANRIANAVEQHRTARRADTLDRIRRVVRDVNQELIRARTREELESRVCEVVSSADPYALVWIGEPDETSTEIVPRASAGAQRGYLDSLSITLDESATARGPTARAIQEGELTVTQSIPEDPAFEPWRERALAHGFRASAAVPIRFEGTIFGSLNVYTDVEGAFDETERELLRELGADVGHAIHRIESERQFRQLFERFPEPTVAVTFADDDPIIQDANPAFESVFGYDATAVVGESANDLIVPDDRHDEAADIDERSRQREFIDQQVTRRTTAGTREFLLRNIPVLGESGPDLYWVYVDITERIEQERELETLAERLELAVEAGQFGVWDWDIRTDEVTFNDRWSTMLGYAPEEIQPSLAAWESRVHPEDLPEVEAALEAHFAGETDHYDCDHRMRTREGEWKWIRDVGRVVERDEDGDPLRAVGIHQDVTEVKERTADLRHERERFASLFESFPASVVAVSYEDDVPVVRDANSTFEDVFGYDRTTASGRSLNDLIVPDDRHDEAHDLDRRLQRGGLIDQEVRRTAADGVRDFVLRTITLSADHALDTYAVYIDVTPRKNRERAMTALHDAAADLETAATDQEVYDVVIDTAEEVLDFALVAIDVLEDDALVQQAHSIDRDTDGYYSTTPIDEETLATRAFRRGETIRTDDLRDADITPADPEYRSALTVPIGDIGTFQTVARHPDAFDETDAELAELLVGHAREALGRLERARSLRRQRERLRREYDRLDTFVSILSHDLRNPITVAEGRVDLANEAHHSDHLDVAADALDRMHEMVEDVLTWAREGQHVPEEDRTPVALDEMAPSSWRTVDTADATIDVTTDQTIRADRHRLQHVLENLFRNAVEHGSTSPHSQTREDAVEHGGHDAAPVTVTLGALDDGFFVADDGPGIPEEDRDEVFSFGHSTAADGTGFGLTIVKEIVEAHEWEIAVTESEGGGARFEITGVDVVE